MNTKYLVNRSLKLLSNGKLKDFIIKSLKYLRGDNKIDLDKLVFEKNISLDDIFLRFGTDKGSLDGKKTYDYLRANSLLDPSIKNYLDWIKRDDLKKYDYQAGMNFTATYERLFGGKKDKKIKLLEIGVANGHSIASWHRYFPNAEIFAIDKKDAYKFFYTSSRISFNSISLTDKKKIDKFINFVGNFDVIIDDSLHEHWAMATNIKNFYKALKPGGIYILEDFRTDDYQKQQEINFNNNKGTKHLWRSGITIEKMFEMISQKKLFKHHVLDQSNIEYILNNTQKAEVVYTDHPWGSLAILHKKN
mgnify:CR=1 FL=1|tara:strand:+ start:999 stop:1913 length:915 start_codon:yes stop_codon:yes gene_type:complete